MEKLHIVGWAHFDDAYPTKALTQENGKQVLDLVCAEIYTKGYRFSGEQHQNALTGMPVFSDGTCFRASMRCFASLMVQIYSHKDGKEYGYMDFYMSADEELLPESTTIDVIASDQPDCLGQVIHQDRQLIIEALQMGMPLMTTDKVVSEMYEYYKLYLAQQQEEQAANEE